MNRPCACWAAACIALFAGGCDDGAADAPNTAPRGRTGPALLPSTGVQNENGDQAEQPAELRPKPAQQPGQPAEPEQEEEELPERDFDAELKEAFGSPVSCLKSRLGPEAPTEIRITLEAHLLDNGMVTRSSASSPQLDSEELRCVRSRLSGLRLRQPIEDAPRSARTTIELQLKAPEKSGS